MHQWYNTDQDLPETHYMSHLVAYRLTNGWFYNYEIYGVMGVKFM